MPIDYAAFAYAASVAGGGILGYVKSSKLFYFYICKISLLIVIVIVIN